LTDPEARHYFGQILQLNPLYDPAGVLALRRKTLGLPAAVREEAFQGAATSQQRATVMAALDRIRREFWTLSLSQLQTTLEAINVERLPELRPLVARLRTVAACRGEFPRLASSVTGALPLFHAFKSAVVLPPAEAARHKEEFIRKVRDRQQVKLVRRTVRSIEREHPMLYELEKDWFETLSKLKVRRSKASKAEGVPSRTGDVEWSYFSPALAFAVIVMIRILLAVMR
jgi:hypothetical protein